MPETVFRYDVLNRLITVNYPTSQFNIIYRYDQGPNGISRLTQLNDNSGQTRYQYDERGNLLQQALTTQGTTYVTAYTYDNADNLTQMTYPSGRIITMNRDALGRIAQMATSANGSNQTLIDNISYLPFGPIVGYSQGNGLTTTYSYDQDYRLSSQSTVNVLSQSYLYDAVNNITTITDSVSPANDQFFGYDNLDRLDTAQGSYGDLAYSYDAVGNRQSESQDSQNTSYNYDANSQQLANLSGSDTANFGYDANGNLTSENTDSYVYSDINRLAQASSNGQSTDYRYNGRGERTVKTNQSGTTVYHYDPSGLLIAETDASGATLREYAYINGQRLALIDNTGIYYIHSNHLDTPQVMTDQSQTIVWQANYTPFGEATITTASIENNLRFPGQYFDQETGNHYNYFRDYDPSIGRYVQSDSIGLLGGVNTYAYVLNNPVRFIDPLGLATCQGEWRRIGFVREPFAAITFRCVCNWSCFSCTGSGRGDAFPVPNPGQFRTEGTLSFDARNSGKGFDPEGGNQCLCAQPGPETGCHGNGCDNS
ncbi:MAG: RHS domain-containing protein [Pseudomonadales bacterium]|nr:RHS domain-containing protein [Pseudomonadales bacterium]